MRLKVRLNHDEYLMQHRARFLDDAGRIRHKHDKVLVPGGPVTHHPIRSLDSIECKPIVVDGDTDAGSYLKSQLRVKQLSTEIEQLQKKVSAWQTELDSNIAHRHEYNDVVTMVMTHFRGMSTAKEEGLRGPAAKRRALQEAVVNLTRNMPDLRAKMYDMVSPTSVLGALFDVCQQRAETDHKHVRYPPVLIAFALNVIAKSPTTYRMLRSALPSLPSPTTLSMYTYVCPNTQAL